MSDWLKAQFQGTGTAFRREFSAFFATPLAYVFLAIFLLALGLFTWEVSGFFNAGAADLSSFFVWHPWLYMIFMPALAMRLWADERSLGTDELLLSLPVGMPGLVTGKLLAAWAVAGVALLMTVPMWITVNFLGRPDNAAILISYLMSFLMALAYLSIGAAVSALTSSQVMAFVISVLIAFVFTAAGWPVVLSAVQSVFGTGMAELAAGFSFLTHFESAERGVLDLRSVAYFLGIAVFWASLNGLWASRRRLG